MNVGEKEVLISVTRSIRDQIEGNSERLKLFISGNARTLKTFLLNLLKN